MTAADVVQLPLRTGALRNVTAYSRFGDGIRVTAGNFAQLVLNVTNAIVQGGFSDVRAEIVGSHGDRRAEVNLDHSNYSSRLRTWVAS